MTASRPTRSTPSSSALVEASPSRSPCEQRLFQRAPLLAQVAGAVGGDPVGQLRHRLGERSPRHRRHHLGAPPGPDERERPAPCATASASRSRGLAVERRHAATRPTSRPVDRGEPGRQQRRLPQGERHPAARRAVLGHGRDRQPGQPGRGRGRIADRRRGQDEDRRRCRTARRSGAAGGSPARRASRRRPGRRGTRRSPRTAAAAGTTTSRVPGQHAAVQHVRVGEHEAASAPVPTPARPTGVSPS